MQVMFSCPNAGENTPGAETKLGSKVVFLLMRIQGEIMTPFKSKAKQTFIWAVCSP